MPRGLCEITIRQPQVSSPYDGHTALSESAVHVRVHRISDAFRQQHWPWVLRPATRTSGVGQILPILPKKTRAAMKDFSLKHSAVFLPISKSRRQVSLDTRRRAVKDNDSNPALDRNCCPLPLHVTGVPGDSTKGATSRPCKRQSPSASTPSRKGAFCQASPSRTTSELPLKGMSTRSSHPWASAPVAAIVPR